MKKHLWQMAVAAALILAILVLVGVPLPTAARYAALLACPLMMVGMMFFMNRGMHHGPTDAAGSREPSRDGWADENYSAASKHQRS